MTGPRTMPARIEYGPMTAVIAIATAVVLTLLLWQISATATIVSVRSGDGSWLTDIFARTVAWAPWPWPLASVLSVLGGCILGMMAGWLYERLVYNDWSRLDALIFVGALIANSAVVATMHYLSMATLIACIVIVPAIRRVESVGDVQATMSLGLALPILLLAGPQLAPLILPLAFFGALYDPVARHDLRAFIAMFLVAIMPTLLVITGMFGLLGPAETWRLATEVYAAAFTPDRLAPGATEALLRVAMFTVLPFAPVTLFYLIDVDRRWQPVSAAMVLLLPAWLIAGTILFSWPIPLSLPTAAFLGSCGAWLSAARLKPHFRLAAMAVMMLSAILSWTAMVLEPQLLILVQPG